MDFVCYICNIEFNKKSHLTDHFELKHLLLGPRKCFKCASYFKQICNFTAHYKKKHLECSSKKCTSKNLCKKCDEKIKSVKREWKNGKHISQDDSDKKV